MPRGCERLSEGGVNGAGSIGKRAREVQAVIETKVSCNIGGTFGVENIA